MKVIAIMCLLTGLVQGQVQEWDVGKYRIYRQTADNTAPTAPFLWAFEIWIATANSGDSTTATISGGGLVSPLALEKDGNSWELFKEYASEAALDLAFPNGASYTITLSGGTLGTQTQTFTMAAKNYPNIAYLTGKGYTRAQSMDATQSHQLNWNTPNAAANYLYVEAELRPDDTGRWEEGFDTAPLPQSVNIPANTFSLGSAYNGSLAFLHDTSLSGVGGFGVSGFFFQEQLTLFEIHTVVSRTPQAIVGAWQFGNGAAGNSGVLVFQANGVYFHAEDSENDLEEQSGIERGTYTWNPDTGAFSAVTNAASDTNGETGLSHPDGAITMTVSGNTLTFTDDAGSFNLTRVGFNSAKLIEGAWSLTDNKGLITGCLVFLPNNVYFHMEVFSADGSNGNNDTDGQTGIERGTYSFNIATGKLDSTATVDTNIQYGLSDPIVFNVIDFSSPRVMNFNEDGSHKTQYQLHRISNATVMPDWRLNKSRFYNQTADNTAPSTPTYWNTWGFVETRNPEDATTITISGGGISGNLSYTREGNEWEMNREYASEAALDAEFPSSNTYTITLSGGALGTLVQKIPVGAKNYASAPYLKGTQFTDVMAIDPTNTLPISWGGSGFGSTQLEIYAQSGGNETQYYFWSAPAPLLSHVVPAHTMAIGGNDYEGYLELGNGVDVSGNSGFGPLGSSAHHSALEFVLKTNTVSGLLTSFATDAGLVGSNTLPLATPHSDGVENLVKFAFNMDLSAADTSTLMPGTGNSGLPVFEINDDGPSTVFQVEFVRRISSGLIYTPKRSTNLTNGSFTPMTGTVTVTPIDDQFERVTVTEPCDPATTPRCFGRVEVTLP